MNTSHFKYRRPVDGIWYTETEIDHPVFGKLKTIRPFAPGQRWRVRAGAPDPFVLVDRLKTLWNVVYDLPNERERPTVGAFLPGIPIKHVIDVEAQALAPFDPRPGLAYVFMGWGDPVTQATPSSYPHKCPRCGSPAYVGVVPTALDCSSNECASKKKEIKK